MEDFGYKKTGEKENNPLLIKKFFLISATFLSLSIFIYISIKAYYFISAERSDKDVETIAGPTEPIKISEGDGYNKSEEERVVNRSIYDDIFGNRKEIVRENLKINNNSEPANPLHKSDDNNIKNSQEIVKNDVAIDDKDNPKNSENIAPKNEASNKKTIAQAPVFNDKIKSDAEVQPENKPAKRKRSAIRVQISAMSSRDGCEDYWDKLNRLYPEVFSRAKHYVEEVDLGKRGTFYRLQIGDFFNQIDAEQFCAKYISRSQKSSSECIVVE